MRQEREKMTQRVRDEVDTFWSLYTADTNILQYSTSSQLQPTSLPLTGCMSEASAQRTLTAMSHRC